MSSDPVSDPNPESGPRGRPLELPGGGNTLSVALRAFRALCMRDLWVTVRHEPVSVLSQALLQPIFFLFVFGRVLPEIGAAQAGFSTTLLPGIIALTTVLTALQNTALPLVIEFSFTKEIEDRLLAPLPVWAVAVQKVLVAALRGAVAGALILPLGELILPGGISLAQTSTPGLVLVLVAGSLVGAVMGMLLGTAVPPERISVAFAIVLTPLIFTGATFYPWQSLGSLEWFQVVTLANPLTYISEAMRAVVTGAPHLGTEWIVLGIAASLVIFGALSLRGFQSRAVD